MYLLDARIERNRRQEAQSNRSEDDEWVTSKGKPVQIDQEPTVSSISGLLSFAS